MKLIIIRGPGGSGKTTVARMLSEKLREKEKFALLESDTFYWGISGEEHNDDIVYTGIRKLEELYLENSYSVIIEGVLTSMNNGILRINDFTKAGEKYNANIHLFYLTLNKKEAERRVKAKSIEEGWEFHKEEFEKWYNRSDNRKHESEIEIACDDKSTKEIVDLIIKIIEK